MDCIFCKLANKEIPLDSEPLYEDDNLLVVYDKFPKAPVHILFIVKPHIGSLLEVTPEHTEMLGNVMVRIREIADKEGLVNFKVVSNSGKFQEIKHLHFHLASGEDLKMADI